MRSRGPTTTSQSWLPGPRPPGSRAVGAGAAGAPPTTPARRGGTPGPVIVLLAATLLFGFSGVVLWPVVGVPVFVATIVAVVLLLVGRHRPVRRDRPVRSVATPPGGPGRGRRPSLLGVRLIGATSLLEGVAFLAGPVLLVPAGVWRWWLPVLVGAVAVHLTMFAVFIRRTIDLVLVPAIWVVAAATVAGVALGSVETAWTLGGAGAAVVTSLYARHLLLGASDRA